MSGQNSTPQAPAPYFQEEGKPACALAVMPGGHKPRIWAPPRAGGTSAAFQYPKIRVGCNCELPTGSAAVSAKFLNGSVGVLGGRAF